MPEEETAELRDVTVRSYEDIDDAPMMTGKEKQALAAIIEKTEFQSAFLLPEFKLDEDDHQVVRADADSHVDVEHDCGRLAVGYWEDYSEQAIRVTQFHRKNDPAIETPNAGCYIPKSTTVVIDVEEGVDSIDTPQTTLTEIVGGDV